MGGRAFVSAVDTPPNVGREVEVLFREARQRRRRRWVAGISILVLVLVAAGIGIAVAQTGGHSPPLVHQHLGPPEWSTPTASKSAPPSDFVAGDNQGGIGVYATATGRLIRHLSGQTSGGPDQQPVVSASGTSVYFVQPQGPCSASIQTVPVSGSQPSSTAISGSGIIALDPAPSPSPGLVAWVGALCGSESQPTLYLSNETTGQRSDLGPYTGRTNDEGLAWSNDGTLLAVEASPIVKVLDASDLTGPAQQLTVRAGCMLSDPAFVSYHDELAVINTCPTTAGGPGSSDVLIYSAKTGHPVALAVKAPRGAAFQSLSVDSSGHVLVGLSPINGGAEIAFLSNGRLITVSHQSPTGAQWITAG